MELDERSRQLGEVSQQLCEVGSVGRASAARLYAAGNAATAEKETGRKFGNAQYFEERFKYHHTNTMRLGVMFPVKTN